MTTNDLLLEVARGATTIQYDPNHYQLDEAVLRAAGAKVYRVPRASTPTGKVQLALTYRPQETFAL
jgi:hypothetical protein